MVAEIAAVLSALAAVGAVVLSFHNGRKIQEVHLSLNSRLDALLKAGASAAHAEGLEEGRKESR